ncbi:Uncharacterized protein TCM_002379 [Theobroma cacao]|uniref:Uncharacterized protein n=1 Tax=Theobroma cacao TaxID=3641 RepID=A0A061DM41_THECC|nr:Uncharacterized protein TCM_002379 [Theobroma cacao]
MGTYTHFCVNLGLDALNFFNAVVYDCYKNLLTSRTVYHGRVIDLKILREFGFLYIENFRNLGWHEYLSLNIPVFENLVKVFYSNANVNYRHENDALHTYDNAFTTYIMGRLIKITPELIKDVFGLHSGLGTFTYIGDNPVVQDLERELYVNNISALDSITRLSMTD